MRFALFVVVAVACAADAQSPPPPPQGTAAANASAWACTRKTLLDQAPCTVEGKTQPTAASKDQAKENQRQAKILADDLCAALATGEAPEADAGVLAVCSARAAATTKRCGGDGSRRLLDDAGRFNPGHAKCYAALAELVRDVSAVIDDAGDCCRCIHDSCNGSEEQCVARIADERVPDASAACLGGVCSSVCAQAKLFAPTTTRKP